MPTSRPTSPSRSPPTLKSALKHSPLPSPPAIKTQFDNASRSSTSLKLDIDSRDQQHGSQVTKSDSHASTTVPGFRRRVGFDTFDDGAETGAGTGIHYSFTLSAKTQNYCRTKQSRTFMIATDLNEYSVHALDWALDNLVEDHDEVVVLRVIEPGTTVYASWKADVDAQRVAAQKLLDDVIAGVGQDRQVFISVEFAVGPIEEMIHRLIEVYKPDSLIVGTRGKTDSVWRNAFMGSISRYCVARSPVPVIVVRPAEKVADSLSKRIQDPSKRSYVNLLGVAGSADDGNKLSRTVTAPTQSNSADSSRPSSRSGGKFLTPDDAAKPKKSSSKSLKMKRFGTVD